MENLDGCVDIFHSDNKRPEPSIRNQAPDGELKSPKTRDQFMNVVQAQRKVRILKDTLHTQERLATGCRNDAYLREVMGRWDHVHDRRHLLSPFADRFVEVTGRLNHGAKSKFLK
ncbi:hypothetical protein BWQ96_06482 [Gracilariopsis chorda]|uniref:Uncharacterized protein n=1 Tax=Gracilariopsis chorda TaxID=448386 RepID=A0A2V3IRG7_9FLOR|nr:hypothetical protein BWQ96_06482 [Gracilariopsis chorda]|eukprot:PXF43750.1 hypothetical protein BWQ96_06482 [Gracilariopsis chorda]